MIPMNYIYRPKNFRGYNTPTTRYIVGSSTRSRRPVFQLPHYRVPWRSISLVLVGAILIGGIGIGGYNLRNYLLEKNNQKIIAQKQAEEAESAKKINELKSQVQNGADAIKLGRQKQDEGSLREAEAAYLLALRYEPNWRDAYLSLGQTQMALRKYADAELSLNRALTIDPIYPTTQTLLAMLYQKTGRKEEARLAQTKAQELAKRLGLEIGG